MGVDNPIDGGNIAVRQFQDFPIQIKAPTPRPWHPWKKRLSVAVAEPSSRAELAGEDALVITIGRHAGAVAKLP